MAEYCLPKRGVAFITYMGLVSQADTKLLIASPTLAAGDFKISKDGGATANLATLPTNTPAASSQIKISISATEMEADNVTIVGIDAAGAEWCSFCLNIQTATRAAEDLAFPTTSGRSIDVTAGGTVGVDWANVEAPTTTLALTNTTIATTQKVDVETIKTNPVVNAGTVTFPTTATLASTTNITAGTITTTTNLTNLPAAAALEATLTTMKGATFVESTDSLEALRDRGDAAWTTAAGFSTHSAADVWTSVTRTLTAATNLSALAQASVCTEARLAELDAANIPADVDTLLSRLSAARALLLDEITAVRMAVLTDWIDGGRLDLLLDAVKAKTDNLPASPAAVGSTMVMDQTQAVSMVDVSADATLTVGKALLGAWVQAAGDWSISGTTLTLKNPDGTTFRTFTLDSATAPTSRT